MRQKSESPTNNELSWLQNRYEQRKSRSVELGINAIDKLVKDNKPVSYHTVSELTRVLDPDGEGIHPNTIRRNSELQAYFTQHQTAKPYKARKKAVKRLLDDMESFKQIKINRDLERVKLRYMQSTKSELVEHIIRLEQYVAQQNQIWLKNEFEKFQ
ncbi:hypothetical protein [Paenibacillus sp. YAF4_2]|uniref:hypothetical protein n=1 Tax=Paenibacillus sp. YAF4_2 TaxID=3233085 RepID=UPI003F9B2020